MIDLTVGELKELFESLVPKITPVVPTQSKSEKRLVYGLKGIKELFHVSDSTARKLKRTNKESCFPIRQNDCSRCGDDVKIIFQ